MSFYSNFKDDVTSPTTVEEIFAEVTTVTTEDDGHFKNTTITLERQVAGLLAYLKNVPAKINNNDVEKVQIKANKKQLNLNSLQITH